MREIEGDAEIVLGCGAAPGSSPSYKYGDIDHLVTQVDLEEMRRHDRWKAMAWQSLGVVITFCVGGPAAAATAAAVMLGIHGADCVKDTHHLLSKEDSSFRQATQGMQAPLNFAWAPI